MKRDSTPTAPQRCKSLQGTAAARCEEASTDASRISRCPACMRAHAVSDERLTWHPLSPSSLQVSGVERRREGLCALAASQLCIVYAIIFYGIYE